MVFFFCALDSEVGGDYKMVVWCFEYGFGVISQTLGRGDIIVRRDSAGLWEVWNVTRVVGSRDHKPYFTTVDY